ncbi:pyridoxamine 5'-phosphate oxidase family protein [Candidatus Lucifugimonas marina]|jgi:PPOX class probable FMN-dependent enzyme|uniref:Pyridoxamine 5'-phosphate oxidase family protein n=1 Tax=Candidatus Lucifugimonas marina TaxID=3038979 RepID=A0AAJ5ZJD7_9CHLR|nr:pyridoxamine 5'-phosphate oxidase family protein [SAR202 cluster bacterium JH702]MDG0870560.1 pyridoxamine 5'-phosphate oxidase family protein [SAR202 cluster bacterium JH639]WFG35898.1 pyridoxamine 5'-phosphate oxidase family protein [SAR202 cluster bacterium JH545]WFG39841.1 pyridoxamine 5'-phosphate oxidase family protein [SAR202 cluster bacterium JH1073]
MSEKTFQQVITTEDGLREILGTPSKRAADKVIDHIDDHCAALIGSSPFLVIASADADGNMDVSPKGDPAGFVRVLDEHTLVIPDRKGNRRGDTFSNILQNPKVGLIFLTPGYQETLRVSGTARIVRDPELLESMAHKGSVPMFAIVIDVEKALFHCAKCIIRSGLWEHDEVEGVPNFGAILKDHADLDQSADEVQQAIDESKLANLY